LNWYFPVSIGRYFLVFTIPIPKEILVGTYWYHFFGGNPYFPQKGGTGPLLEEKGGNCPLFDTASPLLRKKGVPAKLVISTGNTDRQVKFDTGKIPIPKKLLVTPCGYSPPPLPIGSFTTNW
jgi:hypothetical protein